MAFVRLRLKIFLCILTLPITPAFSESKMVVEIHPLGLADFEAAEKIAKDLVSPEGKLVVDRERDRLILYDYPAKQEALRKALAHVTPPTHLVHIQINFKENSTLQAESVNVNGLSSASLSPAQSSFPSSDKSPPLQTQTLNSSRVSFLQQDLMIMSGAKARFRMGTDLPYADWIWNYGLRHKLWSGTTSWRKVGAQMMVEPYVLPDRQIRIRLTPEFSYILGQETFTTAIEKLTTEIITHEGQEIELSQLSVPDREFYSRFLVGYTYNGEKCLLHIILKPTLEE